MLQRKFTPTLQPIGEARELRPGEDEASSIRDWARCTVGGNVNQKACISCHMTCGAFYISFSPFIIITQKY